MQAQSHLNRHLDVIKHKKIYKRIRVTLSGKATRENAERHALEYFEKLGVLELFREIGQTGNVVEFEGLVVVNG